MLALANSDINFGIDIRPTYVCNHCKGNRYDLLKKLKPTFLEQMSVKINSLFFQFILDETMNYSSIVRIILLSRILKKRIKLLSKLISDNLLFIIALDLPSFFIMSKPILTINSVIFILLFHFPLNCVAFLSISESMDFMKIIVASKRIKGKFKDTRNYFTKSITLFYKLVIYGVTALVFNIIYFSLMKSIYSVINNSVENNNLKTLNPYIYSEYFSNLSYIDKNIKGLSDFAKINITNTKTNISMTIQDFTNQNFDFLEVLFGYFTIIFLFVISAISLDKREHLFSSLTVSNYKVLVFAFIPVLIWTLLFTFRILNSDENFNVIVKFYCLIILVIWCVLIILIDYFYKSHKKRYYFNKQKNIKLMLETRLGTFSPK